MRLPVGYFTLGPQFCKGTPFAPYSQVYANAWLVVKSLVARAYERGIGTLIDFHAVPGGANANEHSGTNSDVAALWCNKNNLDQARKCILFIAEEIALGMHGVIGLQVCNEAVSNASGMYDWYDTLLSSISAIDPTIPLYISDAWDLAQAIRYAKSKNQTPTNPPSCPIVIDTHLYFCFSETDKAKSTQQIIASVPSSLDALNGHDGAVTANGAAQVVVGEYSCVLDSESWARSSPECDRNRLRQDFASAQSSLFRSRTGGAFFWTLKMDWMPGGEWGFVAQTESGQIRAPPNLELSFGAVRAAAQRARLQRRRSRNAAKAAHKAYWQSVAPGKRFEHWRFEEGWDVGFEDAMCVFEMRANGALRGPVVGWDRIGCMELWVLKRLRERSVGAGEFEWEFEHGLRRGIADFYDAADV